MVNSNDGGANVSINGGESWTDQDFPTAQFYNVFTTAHVPYHVCGAQQDNSTACVPSTGSGELYQVGGGESGYIAPDPRRHGRLLRRQLRRAADAHQPAHRRAPRDQRLARQPDGLLGRATSTERFQWTFPIVIAPTDPNTLYVTSQHVWKSTNEGQSWQRISPDLTRHDPATLGPSGGPITLDQTGVETYATIFTLAPSPLDGNVIWAGSDDGLVHVTRDGGKNWTKVTPPDLPAFTRISLIEASPHDAGDGLPRRQPLPARGPRALRLQDRRLRQDVDEDRHAAFRPTTSRARSARTPSARGCCSSAPRPASTSRSTTARRGSRCSSSCRSRRSTASQVKNDDLVIGTHGRSFYVMDNIGVLRQIGRETTNEPVVLFDPSDAIAVGLARRRRSTTS